MLMIVHADKCKKSFNKEYFWIDDYDDDMVFLSKNE